jgi:hypothetical protein
LEKLATLSYIYSNSLDAIAWPGDAAAIIKGAEAAGIL